MCRRNKKMNNSTWTLLSIHKQDKKIIKRSEGYAEVWKQDSIWGVT